MPITPSFPGLYIEEIPLSTHTIAAAQTSITVFVGYTHQFQTLPENFGQAQRISNLTEYEQNFGGFFRTGMVPTDLPLAVSEFFQNGGSDAYVVALKANYAAPTNPKGPSVGAVADFPPGTTLVPATAPLTGLVFTAREFIDQIPMQLKLSNPRESKTIGLRDTFDLAIAYGNRVETYRGVQLTSDTADLIHAQSSLVDVTWTTTASATDPRVERVDLTATTTFPVVVPLALELTVPMNVTTFGARDYLDVFQDDTSLDKVPIFNLLVMPGVIQSDVQAAALAFAEKKRAFVILDSPFQAAITSDAKNPGLLSIGDWKDGVPESANGALYFPYLNAIDPIVRDAIQVAPSGYVAGVYARTDTNRGVWKAPAGIETTINGTTGVVARGDMNDQRHGVLNPKGVNCIRNFPNSSPVVFGARTLVSGNTAFQQSWYVPVRRMTLFIEQTLLANLRWVVFEPNDDPLWIAIRMSIESFLHSLFSQGALQGTKTSQAFQVKCDSSTTTDQDIANGVVNIVVAFAPLKPAEFVVIKIAQLAGQSPA